MGRRVCEWPGKQRHASKTAALAAIGAMYRDGKGNPDLQPYECAGHWHVGHSVVHFRERIKRVTRRRAVRRSKTNSNNRRTR